MTMIERVTLAICRLPMHSPPEDVARAAIAAMREPTDGMLRIGLPDEDDVELQGVIARWQAMIDAALSEKE